MGKCLELHLKLFLFLFFCEVVESSNIYNFRVDGNHGIDNDTCCNSGSPCASIELAFHCVHQQPSDSTLVIVSIMEGNYSLTKNTSLTTFVDWMQGITIEGVVLNNSNESGVEITCEPGAGLTFVNSNNIAVRDITLCECGKVHNSTSRDFSSIEKQFLPISTAVYFLLCRNVTISSTIVGNTDGTGVVMYSTVGQVTIEYSQFHGNAIVDNTQAGGGGLYIEFCYCIPGNETCVDDNSNVPYEYTHGANYFIDQSLFGHNVGTAANQEKLYTFIFPEKSNHFAFGRGGGMSVFFKGYAHNNTVIVNGSVFISNIALWGGGIFVEYQDFATLNQFAVYNSALENNYLYNKQSSKRGTGGGGSRVGFIFYDQTHVENNSVLYDNCKFINNSAYFGGGLSFYTAREPEMNKASNTLKFTKCVWKHNVARAGSAVDLSVWHPSTHGALVKVSFDSCQFEQNTGNYTSHLGKLLGIGAMYLDSIPIVFNGSVVYRNNTHSALAAVNTGIYFSEGCEASFIENSGHNGGAISLLGFAFLEVSEKSSLLFINNTAHVHGGAIFGQSIGEHNLISSRNCFIRYSNIFNLPDSWDCKFYFEGNTATDRTNSIYATSLLPCLWGTVYGSFEANTSRVFCWNDTVWNYASGTCEYEIETSPARFDRTKSLYNITVYPGKVHHLPVTMLDDRHMDVTNTTVFTASSLSNNLEIDSTAEYISDNNIKLHGKPNSTGSFNLDTVDPRVVHTEITVTILSCPLGMIESWNGDSAVCKCGYSNFGGLLHCNPDTFVTEIQRGYWVGQYVFSGSKQPMLAVGACPYCRELRDLYDHNIANNQSLLPSSDLCDSINRQGSLCGRCKDGFSPAVGISGFTCTECSIHAVKYGWLLFVLEELGPITLLFFFLFFFNIKIVSARANSLIFFVQVVPIAFTLDSQGTMEVCPNKIQKALTGLYTIPLNIFNLDFNFFPPYCLSPNMSSLMYISLGYVSAAYPLILSLVVLGLARLNYYGFKPIVYVLRPLQTLVSRFDRKFEIGASLIHAFATFLQLSYTKFTLVSFFLLDRTPLLNEKGNGPSVVYYDGTLHYLHGNHIGYFSIAILMMLTFTILPPMLLFIPSNKLKKVALCFSKCLKFIRRESKKQSNEELQDIVARDDREQETDREQSIDEQVSEKHDTTQTDHNQERQTDQELITNDDEVQDKDEDEGGWQYFNTFLECFRGEFKDGIQENTSEKQKDLRWFSGFYFALRLAVFAVYAFASNPFMQFTLQQFICVTAILMLSIFRPYKKDFYNKVDSLMFTVLIILNTSTMYNFYRTGMKSDPSIELFVFQLVVVFGYIAFSLGFIATRWQRRRNWKLKRTTPNCHSIKLENDEVSQLLKACDNRQSNQPYKGYRAAEPHDDRERECDKCNAEYSVNNKTSLRFSTARDQPSRNTVYYSAHATLND